MALKRNMRVFDKSDIAELKKTIRKLIMHCLLKFGTKRTSIVNPQMTDLLGPQCKIQDLLQAWIDLVTSFIILVNVKSVKI